jgi:hypothetical protein
VELKYTVDMFKKLFTHKLHGDTEIRLGRPLEVNGRTSLSVEPRD